MPPAVLAARFAAQLLTGPPAPDPVAVTGRLLAVQAQDPRGARLAIRVRSAGLTAADVDRALTRDRSLLITWLNRGTLHLIRSADYWWLHPLVTPPLVTASARRLAQEGVTPDAAADAVAVIERSLAAEGALTRTQLRTRLHAAGIHTAGQALVHELLLATLRGIAVRGPMADGEHAYVLTRDWLGPPPAQWRAAWVAPTGAGGTTAAVGPARNGPTLNSPAPAGPAREDTARGGEPGGDWRDRALAELARRFLAGHGPASDRDLAKWSGLPLR
ncbi:MAG TPA: crosslink repair DNA glycosylase YcaQ family protein, partial [Streptosporangiaceae bacterium]